MKIAHRWPAALAAALALSAPMIASAQPDETTRTTIQTTTTQYVTPSSTVTVIVSTPVVVASTPTIAVSTPAPTVEVTTTTTVTTETRHEQPVGIYPGLQFGGRATYMKVRGDSDDWFAGAQLRVHMTRNWAVEGAADYRQTSSVDVFPVQASLIGYLVPDGPVTPYVLAGAGWYFTHVRSGSTTNRFGPHVGGGLEFLLDRHWSIDGSYRYIWINNFHSENASVNENIYRGGGHMVTIALNYRF